jgi:hypothetical protein
VTTLHQGACSVVSCQAISSLQFHTTSAIMSQIKKMFLPDTFFKHATGHTAALQMKRLNDNQNVD